MCGGTKGEAVECESECGSELWISKIHTVNAMHGAIADADVDTMGIWRTCREVKSGGTRTMRGSYNLVRDDEAWWF
jgi:hypothetical protein